MAFSFQFQLDICPNYKKKNTDTTGIFFGTFNKEVKEGMFTVRLNYPKSTWKEQYKMYFQTGIIGIVKNFFP